MLVHILPTPFYGANCMVVTPSEGPALVIDPSHGVIDRIRRIIDEAGLPLGAVLLTHGHPDHVWDCAEVASWAPHTEEPAPVWLPAPDMYRMDSPLTYVQIPPAALDLPAWRAPDTLRAFPSGAVELVPGLWMKMVPAPGHTEGSALFIAHSPLRLLLHEGQAETEPREIFRSDVPTAWALSGDVIFAGSVGRTDLSGGDETQMRHSLRTIANALDPATILLPGHGPMTTLADQIATNPYLQRAMRIG